MIALGHGKKKSVRGAKSGDNLVGDEKNLKAFEMLENEPRVGAILGEAGEEVRVHGDVLVH